MERAGEVANPTNKTEIVVKVRKKRPTDTSYVMYGDTSGLKANINQFNSLIDEYFVDVVDSEKNPDTVYEVSVIDRGALKDTEIEEKAFDMAVSDNVRFNKTDAF